MSLHLPATVLEHARAYSEGTATPAEPRNAATVVLLREGDRGPDVYLLHRHATMAFAAGMCVFPGGGVDPRDFDASVAWSGPSARRWATRLGTDEPTARALVCAAVRETFEESGVLLAGPGHETVVEDTTGPEWEADRVALESRDLSLADLLVRRGLSLRTDLLGAWSGWLTPEFEPRRFRTWFFVAVLPSGQRTRDVSTESQSVRWMSAIEAVEAVEADALTMLPPTYLTCLEIAQYVGPADVLAESSSHEMEMFMPRVVRDGDGATLTMPERSRALVAARTS